MPFFCLHVHTLVTIYTYQVVKGVSASYETLVDLLESIEHFLKSFDIYSKISPTPTITEIVVKISMLVELFSTLALATKQIQQGRLSGSIFAKVVPVSMQRRKIRKETFWREGRLSGTGEARSAHS